MRFFIDLFNFSLWATGFCFLVMLFTTCAYGENSCRIGSKDNTFYSNYITKELTNDKNTDNTGY